MTELVRCKSCGYITGQSRVKDVCPACGVPAKNMLPYTDPVSPKRRRVLALDIHPIIVHFSVAFSFSALVLAIAALFVGGAPGTYVTGALITLSFFMPLVVLLSFISGLVDAKLRFRRVTTPILTRKIILGVTFFVLSVAMLFVALLPAFVLGAFLKIYILLAIGAFVCAFFLGLLGKGLMGAELPG
jgi:hypothetical protein